jgi:hypothetical protein
MTDLRLYTKITSLPDSLKSEVVDFIDKLKRKKKLAFRKSRKDRIFGYAKDSIIIKSGFDDPIEEFNGYL